MNLNNGIGEQAINKTIEEHPVIGEILQKYDIGCVTCGVGICLVKDVVSIHALGDQVEAQTEAEINHSLEKVNTNKEKRHEHTRMRVPGRQRPDHRQKRNGRNRLHGESSFRTAPMADPAAPGAAAA